MAVVGLGVAACGADEPNELETAIQCCRERPRDVGLRWSKFRLWGYIQLQWTDTEDDDGNLGLRRSKLVFEPRLGRRTQGFVQVLYMAGNDRKTDDHLYLLDAWLRFDLGAGWLQVGQFKPPMGLERFTWDGALDLIERSLATNILVPNGKLGQSFTRDIGVQWTWSQPSTRLTSAVAVFAGRGANTRLSGVAPLWCFRTAWQPQIGDTSNGLGRSFRLGISLSTRKDDGRDLSRALPGTGSIGYDQFSGRDSRAQLEVLYEHGRWRFVAEWFRANFASDRPELPSIAADGGYLLIACQPLSRWSFAVRHETFDPDATLGNQHDATWVTVGATYYLRSNFHKIQINRVFRSEGANEVDNDAWLVRYQLVF